MKNNRIATSLNQITVPADRKGAMLESIFRQADAERASLEVEQKMNTTRHPIQHGNATRSTGNPDRRHRPMKRRTLIVLIAATLLVLTACAAAIYWSTASKLKNEADSQLSRTEEELRADARSWAEVYAGGSAPTIAIDRSAKLADVTLYVKAMEVRPKESDTREAYLMLSFESQETGAIVNFDRLEEDVRGRNTLEAYDSYCEIGMDARDFALTIDGQAYSPYVQADYEGRPEPAAGFDGSGTLSMSFRGLPQIPSGTNMTLSGTLHRCDSEGNRTETIGDFSIPFVYSFTEEDRQAWLDSLSAESVEDLRAGAEARAAALRNLPDSATPINATVEEITFLDIAATEDSFLVGLRYDLQRESISSEQMLTYSIDGYKVANAWVDSDWETDTPIEPAAPSLTVQEKPCRFILLEQLPYYAPLEKLPKVVTVACAREAATETAADDPAIEYSHPAVSFVFRYDFQSGAVTLPQNEIEKTAWLTAASATNSQTDERRE